MLRAVQQVIWLLSFFEKASLPQQQPITLFINNNGAIDMTKTYQRHKRAKHIDVCHHFIKEKVKKREFTPVYIPSKDNIADLLTKLLPKETTRDFVMDLGLCGPGDIGSMWL